MTEIACMAIPSASIAATRASTSHASRGTVRNMRTADEDVGGVAIVHERGESLVVTERQTVRHDMCVDVDERRARCHGTPLFDTHLGTYLKVWSTR